jgi:glycerol-3-phosphate dehydrogenase (NAD(P)+)
MAEIAILGAGVMGSAMAMPAAARGHRVKLVGTHLDEEIVRSVAGNGLHPRLGLKMPEGVTAHPWTEFKAVMEGAPALLILGVSSAGIEWAVERIADAVKRSVPVLMITKGLAGRGDFIEVLPVHVHREVRARTGLDLPVLAVGGPCIAGELAALRDTSVVVTGRDPAEIDRVIELLGAGFYHARRAMDVEGVEVCAAFKNFFALAVGAAAGRLDMQGRGANGALMHNLAAGLFTQSLAEMAVLVEACGGERETVLGLAGAGDLYVTCQAGRNSRMGRLLGLGLGYRAAKAEHMPGDTIEGAELALALGPTLERMLDTGKLPAEAMPLTRAVVDAVCHERPFAVDWTRFHRT